MERDLDATENHGLDVLEAKRFRCPYRGEKIYFIISLKNKRPYEVFAEVPTIGDPTYMFTRAGMEALTRSITLNLRKYPLLTVVRQLRRSSLQSMDLPGILASILEGWLDEDEA